MLQIKKQKKKKIIKFEWQHNSLNSKEVTSAKSIVNERSEEKISSMRSSSPNIMKYKR